MSADLPASEVRFTTSRSTLLADRLMTWFIKIGGMGIIVAVFAIFLFILFQILPLFSGAVVAPLAAIPLPTEIPAVQVALIALDEWGELPLVVARDGNMAFLDATGKRAPQMVPRLTGSDLSACRYDALSQRLIVGSGDGALAVFQIDYASGSEGVTGKRQVTGEIKPVLSLPMGELGRPLTAVAFADAGEEKLAVAVQPDAKGRPRVLALLMVQENTMMGKGEIAVAGRFDLTDQVPGRAEQVLVDKQAESLLVATAEGVVCYFFRAGTGFELRQMFRPFEGEADARVATMDFLLGDVSLVLISYTGRNSIFSLHHKDGSDTRLFGRTKDLPDLPSGGAVGYAPSTRNKGFLVGSSRTASLRFGTSASVRWQEEQPYRIVAVALSGKYARLALAGNDGQVHLFNLADPHPESGFTALFGRLWYEGADAPAYTWQSSGASDDVEPKLSMVPLLAGTLKGTFYALLFAIPVALLGALYTAEFMHPRFKTVVKPAVEIMASLPSVVLGFLAALWLAPLIETRVPSLLLVALLVPTAALAVGWGWSRLSFRWRAWMRPGYEFLAFLPVLVVAGSVAWMAGPWLERLVFAGDFRSWWTATTGARFEQRNSLVVGVMMGFAVIPIIFTIAEDALANVPAALRSGSLALGANRWQTAIGVVLPTASAGIFSALMIGVGRAIGETMIVVMATGNTPIMNLNLFDGMRTLSANIAVELPEAPQFGTLYRTLFLGAFLLFLLTFVINTAAEVLRQHLREKYQTV
jgi:phosphate transport system permease protein